MNRSALAISTLFAGTVLSGFASAETADLKFVGLDYSGTLSGEVTFFNSSLGKDQTEDAYIGKLLFQDGSSQIASVCADITSDLDGSSHTYTVSETNPLDGTSLSAAGNIVAADFNKANNAQSGAALQIAVWSALYNGGGSFNANGSGFKVTGISNSVLQEAAVYYSDFDVKGSAEYFGIAPGCGGQSQLTAVPAPEPASLAALGLGLAALVAGRRRSIA